MRKHIFLFIAIICCAAAIAQDTDSSFRSYYSRKITNEWVTLVGFNSGYSFLLDLGFGHNSYGTAGHHPVAVSYTAGSEIQIGHRDRLFAPKISMHMMGGIAMGYHLIHYTNFKKTSLVFRPEFGFGMERFKFAYGYNWRMSKRDNFVSLNSHLASLVYLIHTMKHEEAREQ
jgi:hypothetical protein